MLASKAWPSQETQILLRRGRTQRELLEKYRGSHISTSARTRRFFFPKWIDIRLWCTTEIYGSMMRQSCKMLTRTIGVTGKEERKEQSESRSYQRPPWRTRDLLGQNKWEHHMFIDLCGIYSASDSDPIQELHLRQLVMTSSLYLYLASCRISHHTTTRWLVNQFHKNRLMNFLMFSRENH